MKNKKCLIKIGKAGAALAVLTAGALLAPASYGQVSVGVNIGNPPPAVAVAPDDYVYYPSYGAYYSAHRHQFYFQSGGSWIWAPTPPGVSADVVLGSPHVGMDFHDLPDHHHADVVRRYPKDWHHER